jgi:predicted nuclease with TOPRIM domain
MMITTERLASVQQLVDKLVEQGQRLCADIAETAEDRARLLQEAEEREAAINKLNEELEAANARNRDLEMRNSRLVDDLMKFETQYNEASALLDCVRVAVTKPPNIDKDNIAPMRRNGGQGLLPR